LSSPRAWLPSSRKHSYAGASPSSRPTCDEVREGNGRNEVAWGSIDMDEVGQEAGVYRNGLTRKLFQSCPESCPGGAQSELIEADILLAPSPPIDFQNEACLFWTLLHEAGHFVGVPHLEFPAVMAPESVDCPQDLTIADHSALAELYEN
jgi:hypothetical protein